MDKDYSSLCNTCRYYPKKPCPLTDDPCKNNYDKCPHHRLGIVGEEISLLLNNSTKELSKTESKGIKNDQGKIRYDLVPFILIKSLAQIYTMGAAKYEANNWQGVESERYYSALFRHLEAFYVSKEELDPESKLHHLAHAFWNIGTLLWKELNNGKC